MKIANDIMTIRVKMVASGDSLESVVKMFLDQGITSSPVINPLGEVLGILTELGLVKAYMLHKAKFHKSDKVGHHVDLLEPVSAVNVDTPIIHVLVEMIASPTHRLLVKDKNGKYVGIISPKDLMKAMLGKDDTSINMKDKLKEVEFQLHQSVEKLKTIEARLGVYEQAFHETPYMMHAVNDKGELIIVNRREYEVLGYDAGELVGKTIFDLYAPEMHQEAKSGLKKIMDTGFHHMTYTTLKKKDGTPVRCDIASAAIYDGKKFVSTISVLRPIDGEELLRTLHGIVNDNGPLSKYAQAK
ncbi:MAG: CBS domain-containing protein [Bdellovibrionota bacterium]